MSVTPQCVVIGIVMAGCCEGIDLTTGLGWSDRAHFCSSLSCHSPDAPSPPTRQLSSLNLSWLLQFAQHIPTHCLGLLAVAGCLKSRKMMTYAQGPIPYQILKGSPSSHFLAASNSGSFTPEFYWCCSKDSHQSS